MTTRYRWWADKVLDDGAGMCQTAGMTNTTKIEQCQLDILDILLAEGGVWTGPDGHVLESLAQRVFGSEAVIGTNAYQMTSMAVLRLEAHGMVTVRRRYRDEHAKANVIESIEVT